MKVHNYISAIALLLLPTLGISQSKSDLIYKERVANETLQKGQYRAALKDFLLLDSLDKNSNHQYQIGLCYINLQEDQKALPYFVKCLETPEKHPNFLYFYTGKSYHLSHQLDSAITYYQKFIATLFEGKSKKKLAKNVNLIKQVNREIEMCEYGNELMANSTPLKIQNLGPKINSPYPDYGIVISADENELFFTSTRPGTTGGLIDNSDGMGLYFEDIYKSYKTPEGWSAPVNIGAPVNSTGNDASISLSADGQKLLIYRSAKENFLKQYSGDIYISTLKGNNWIEPTKLPEQINSSGWETGASLSSDERVLYFSSNREGGYGGNDLYRVKLLPTGEWAMPQNLGPTINTAFDEDSPFIHPDGKTLYFSSNGHKTMGGLDFFVSTMADSDTSWSKPENLGYPISTAHDDIHLAFSADGKKVYFSSNRPDGYGDKDIYYANLEKEEANLIVLKGVITDSTSEHPMEAQITVKDQQTDEVIGVFSSNSESGKYLVVLPEGKNYIFSIAAEDYNECSEIINVPNLEGFEVIDKDIKLCSKPKK